MDGLSEDTGWGASGDWDVPCDSLATMTLTQQVSEPATDSRTFHPFPRLPAEIRCQIVSVPVIASWSRK